MVNLKAPVPEFNDIRELTKGRIDKITNNRDDKDKLIREILLIQDKDLGIVPYYLDNIKKGDSEFTLHTKQGFKLISEMQPNLLRKEYWLISDHGGMGGIKPPRQEYNYDVLDNYLNHILITSNFSIMESIVSDGFYIPLNYGGKEYNYKPKFITTLDHDVYEKYIRTRLEGLYNWRDLEQIISFSTNAKHNRKNILRVVDTFAKGYRNPLSETMKGLGEDVSFTVNRVVKSILLKEPLDKWKSNFETILRDYGSVYLGKSIYNNIENAMKLKTLERIPEKDQFKVRYMNTYINKVDMMDVVYLKAITSKKEDFRITLGKLVKYTNTPTEELYKTYKGGL